MTEPTPTSDDRIVAGLTHLGVLVPMWGMLATLIIWVTQKDKSPFIRFHGLQSGAYQIALFLAGILGWFCYFGLFMGTMGLIPFMPSDPGPGATDPASSTAMMAVFLLPMLIPVLMGFGWLAAVVYGIVGAAKTFRGQPFEYVVIGTRVRKILESGPAAAPSQPAE